MASPENVDRVTNESHTDWWNQYLKSDDPDHVVVQMDKEIELLRDQRDSNMAKEVERIASLTTQRDEYKVWWERDSTSLGKALNEVSSLRAVREESRAAIEQLHAAVKTAQELAATRLMEIAKLNALLAEPNYCARCGVNENEPFEQRRPFAGLQSLSFDVSENPTIALVMRFDNIEHAQAARHQLWQPAGAFRDASPADLVGALQDVVHTDPGPVRAGKAHRDANSWADAKGGLPDNKL